MFDFVKKIFDFVKKIYAFAMGSRAMLAKLDDGARMPERKTSGAAGYDLVCTGVDYEKRRGQYVCHTGVHVQIPRGCFGMVVPRSSIAGKGVRLANCVGVIDSDYRGEITFVFDWHDTRECYKVGERIGQMVVVPCATPTMLQVGELSRTRRGNGGYGSTGR